MNGVLAVVAAYLIGSIPFGLIVVKLTTGADVRESGSGNIGATNVLRTTGPLAGILTLLLDVGKGWFAVWLASLVTQGDPQWMAAAALAVLLGHSFSLFLKFTGGKAVAAFLGAFGYLTPIPLLAVLLIVILVLAMTRYVSLACIVGVGLYPVACWMILHPDWPILAAGAIAAIVIISRHRTNIERLQTGTENVFHFRKTV